MKTSKLKYILVAIIGSFSLKANSADTNIYGISAYSPLGTNLGTGFLVSSGGDFVTAYHVIHGATSIEIIDLEGDLIVSDEIFISGIDAEHDVAILNVPSLKNRGFLKLRSHHPSPSEKLVTSGFPRGMKSNALIDTKSISASEMLSQNSPFRTSEGPLMKSGAKVIPLDMTIYGGLSGAPLLNAENAVLGVVSGSLNEGGSFAWAIPSSYLIDLSNQSFGEQKKIKGFKWPDQKLLASHALTTTRNFNELKHTPEIYLRLEKSLELYELALNNIEKYNKIFDERDKNCDKLDGLISDYIDRIEGLEFEDDESKKIWEMTDAERLQFITVVSELESISLLYNKDISELIALNASIRSDLAQTNVTLADFKEFLLPDEVEYVENSISMLNKLAFGIHREPAFNIIGTDPSLSSSLSRAAKDVLIRGDFSLEEIFAIKNKCFGILAETDNHSNILFAGIDLLEQENRFFMARFELLEDYMAAKFPQLF